MRTPRWPPPGRRRSGTPSASGLVLLLLFGCSNPTGSFFGGSAFVYNTSGEQVRFEGFVLGPVDCAVLDHPSLVVGMPDTESVTYYLRSEDADAPWDSWLNGAGVDACGAVRARHGEAVATLVLDRENGYRSVGLPVSLARMPASTITVDPDGSPVFRDGGTELIAEEEPVIPVCEHRVPEWSGATSVADTLTALHVGERCQTLEFATAEPVSLCDGPELPYDVGEGLVIDSSPSSFQARTSTSAREVRIGTSAATLPSWLQASVFLPAVGVVNPVNEPVCQIQSSCGVGLATNPQITTPTYTDRWSWGQTLNVRTPDNAVRRLTVYEAALPRDLDPTCPVHVVWALSPGESD